MASELGARIVRLRGKVSDELIAYPQANQVGQFVIGHLTHGRWEELLHGSVTNHILRKLPGIDVHIVRAHDSQPRA